MASGRVAGGRGRAGRRRASGAGRDGRRPLEGSRRRLRVRCSRSSTRIEPRWGPTGSRGSAIPTCCPSPDGSCRTAWRTPRPTTDCRRSRTGGPGRRTAPPACWATPSTSPSTVTRAGSGDSSLRWGCATSSCRPQPRPRDAPDAPRAAGDRPVAGRATRPATGARRPARSGVPQRRVGTDAHRRSARRRPRRRRADRIFDAVAGRRPDGLAAACSRTTRATRPRAAPSVTGPTCISPTHRRRTGRCRSTDAVRRGARRSAGPTCSQVERGGGAKLRFKTPLLRYGLLLVQLALWVGGHRPVASRVDSPRRRHREAASAAGVRRHHPRPRWTRVRRSQRDRAVPRRCGREPRR